MELLVWAVWAESLFMPELWVFYVFGGCSHQPLNPFDVLFWIIMTWTLHTFEAFILVPPDLMHDDDDLSLVFYLLYVALKPDLLSSDLKQKAKNQHLVLNREQEKCVCVCGGGIGCSSSYLSLNKSVWWRQQAFSLCSLLLPSYLSAARLCLTVRVLVEHGSSDTFHISCSLLCELSRLWERQKEWQYPQYHML